MTRYRDRIKDVRELVSVPDLFLLISPVVAMSVVYFLPGSVRNALALNVQSPSVYELWTAHFVHAGMGHLLNNLSWYLVFGFLTYVLCILGGERRRFYLVFGLFFVVVAPLVSGLDVYLLGDENIGLSRGFSAVNTMFMGFLVVAIFVFLEEITEVLRARDSIGLGFLSFGVVWMIYGGFSSLDVPLICFGGGIGYYGFVLWDYGVREVREGVGEVFGSFSYTVLVLLGLGYLLVGLVVVFPSNPGGGENITNVVAHFNGYWMGFLVGYGLTYSSLDLE